jgi:cell division protein FtsZ
MSNPEQVEPNLVAPRQNLTVKMFGVGTAGINVLERVMAAGPPCGSFVAIHSEPQGLAASGAPEKLLLETRLLRGLSTGSDPMRGRALGEEHLPKLKALCEGVETVFILSGLGGGAGTGISPVLAQAAREQGALVLAFVLLPFELEGSHRQRVARQGLDALRAVADSVICLPNQKMFKLIDEQTSVLDTFKATNEFLANGVLGFWRLLTHTGLIPIHFGDLCDLLRGRHAESVFAVAEAMGPTRAQELADKLLAHPMLDNGQLLNESEAVLVSLMGGPDLTMAEVNRVMEQINRQCDQAQVIMGAAIDEIFRDRLAVTLIATKKTTSAPEPGSRFAAHNEELGAQLLPQIDPARPGSRFVPPPPNLPPEQVQQLLARQGVGGSRLRKNSSKLRQGQLPLEIVSKGRFDKSEPTIHKGEDLDVPTYIRRGIALN